MTREEAIRRLEDLQRLYLGNEKFTADVEAIGIAIKVLEQQPCEDCISRQAVKETIFVQGSAEKLEIDFAKLLLLQRAIKALPSVTPTRPIGRWIDIQYFKADDTYYRPKCPFCSIEPKEYSNYCPNCGTKMEVEE